MEDDEKPHGNTGKGNKGNLRPPWKPGESGNPSGRPKRRPITDCYIEMACQKMPPDMCKQLAMKRGSTYAQTMVRGQFIKAIKGEVRNASEIRQAIEGNATPRAKHENVDRPRTLEEILEASHKLEASYKTDSAETTPDRPR